MSYAREDSQFALKLANDLRLTGVNLWLDQLDIRGGDRWDRAVEKALETCEGMLVILSPDSVASDNVMDEVAYALEEKKRIIPVVSRKCEIPFRLRRFHHIDFTADDEKTALTRVLAALRIEPRHMAGDTLPASPGASATSSVNVGDLSAEEGRPAREPVEPAGRSIDEEQVLDQERQAPHELVETIGSRGMMPRKWFIHWRGRVLWLILFLLASLASLALLVARQQAERPPSTAKPQPAHEPMVASEKVARPSETVADIPLHAKVATALPLSKPRRTSPKEPPDQVSAREDGIVVKIRGVSSQPDQVIPGQSVAVTMDYAVLAPSGHATVLVQETYELWKDNKLLKNFRSQELSRDPGGWKTSARIPIPSEASPGTYVVKFRIETRFSHDEREAQFVVSR